MQIPAKVGAKVWQQTYDGARAGSMRAFNRLIEIAEEPIRAIAKRQARNADEFEEFCQIGRVYIVKTVNEERKTPIEKVQNYLLKSIKYEITSERQRINSHGIRYIPSSQYKVSDEAGNATEIIDLIPDKRQANPALTCYVNEILEKISKLSAKARTVFMAQITPNKKSALEIAENLNISLDNLYQIKSRLLKDLQKAKKRELI